MVCTEMAVAGRSALPLVMESGRQVSDSLSAGLPMSVTNRTQLELVVVLDGGLIEEPTNENVLFAFEPRVVMAAMHTTTMRANITAYSTAVGPSSAFRNDTSLLATIRMSVLPVKVPAHAAPNGSEKIGRCRT